MPMDKMVSFSNTRIRSTRRNSCWRARRADGRGSPPFLASSWSFRTDAASSWPPMPSCPVISPFHFGPAGDALSSTPPSLGNGTWDVKAVLGDALVYPDGSACFPVPARVPIYFQAIDQNEYAVQSMRSWTTLQPGEHVSCVGCHEHKSQTPPSALGVSQAFRTGPQPLSPFYGPTRGFSFLRELQPILDRHCTGCHKDSTLLRVRMENGPTSSPNAGPWPISNAPILKRCLKRKKHRHRRANLNERNR